MSRFARLKIPIIQNGIEVEGFNEIAAKRTSKIIGLHPVLGAAGRCRPTEKLPSFLGATAKQIAATKVGDTEMVIQDDGNGSLVQAYNWDEHAASL